MTAWILSRTGRFLAVAALALSATGCHDAQAEQQAALGADERAAAEESVYRDMAGSAWRYLDRYYQPATGFVNGTPDWFNTTLWDLGGQILATNAARELGLLSEAEFRTRTQTMLNTLERVELFEGAAFNRVYSTKDGEPDRGSGAGWSATDLGRFLLALKILALHEPGFAAQAERIARRNDFSKIVKDGYLHGRFKGNNATTAEFQEGRIGYEQYVASGFAQWGADVRSALDMNRNAKPIEVLGVKLVGDKRGLDRLVSEPVILYGLELGLSGPMQELAAGMLAAQEARYRSTGQVTIATEDAVAVKPHHFYYYCVYCNQQPFVVGVSSPRRVLDEPRWVSVKGAYGWHALMPNEYTKVATEYVSPALDPELGWATGVFEGTRASTKTYDVTSASVLMEIAYYQLRGRVPLIHPAPVAPISRK